MRPKKISVWNSPNHRAFDASLFTINSDYRIRPSPPFDPTRSFLHETILERDGEQLSRLPDAQVRPSFLEELNIGLSWRGSTCFGIASDVPGEPFCDSTW